MLSGKNHLKAELAALAAIALAAAFEQLATEPKTVVACRGHFDFGLADTFSTFSSQNLVGEEGPPNPITEALSRIGRRTVLMHVTAPGTQVQEQPSGS